MERNKLFEGIELDKELSERVEAIMPELNTPEIEEQIVRLMDIKTGLSAYEWMAANFKEEDNLRMLACNLEAARRVHDRYAEKGISDQVYFDTMKCFPRFLAECKRNTGKVCFDRGWWTYRQLSMELFRIGELEYEFVEWQGKKALSIHIPSDAHFSKELVGESLYEARAFYAKHYPEYEDADYICDTWLLAPALREFLHPESNILEFQARFELLNVNEDATDYLVWLFGARSDTPLKELKEDTSLQKAVKTHVLNGGKIGVAFGIIRN